MTTPARNSYGTILRSSALIGASSIVDIALRVMRVKVAAVLLGPAGVGLMGLFNSAADLATNLAGLGVDNGGVRQIAHAVGSGDRERILLTLSVLRRACAVLGATGALLLAVFASQVSELTFGTADYAGGVAVLSLSIFFRIVTLGYTALLRGMRRIGDLARMEVAGSALATLLSVPLIYFLGEAGIVPSLVAAAAAMAGAAWWYARSVEHVSGRLQWSRVRPELSALVKLGTAFMVSGLITIGVAYAIRVMVLRQLGVEAAGHYQSAWTIGGLYVAFILQAMGTDFYPRLSAVADDSADSNRMVNEQILVSLLLAGPGVLATLTLTPLIITLFYSGKFEAAVGTLRWICLGMSLRVATWPLGFVVIAKGKQALFVWIDALCGAVHLGLAWLLIRTVGLDGAGMAFLGLCVFHGLITYPIARRLTQFRLSAANKTLSLVFVPLIAAVFGSFYVLPRAWATAFGGVTVLLSGAGALRILASLVPPDHLPAPVRRALGIIGVVRAGEAG